MEYIYEQIQLYLNQINKDYYSKDEILSALGMFDINLNYNPDFIYREVNNLLISSYLEEIYTKGGGGEIVYRPSNQAEYRKNLKRSEAIKSILNVQCTEI